MNNIEIREAIKESGLKHWQIADMIGVADEELYEVICEIVCVKRKAVKVNGEDYPYELVKSKFLKLNSSHLEYVIGCMRETTTENNR